MTNGSNVGTVWYTAMDKSDRLAIRISLELKEQLRLVCAELFRISLELKEQLRLVCAERDIPEAQAIREGIRLWLEAKGVKATRKKGGRKKK